MKVLFAMSNESDSESIIKKYQQMYKEIIVSKNVYYFNAIIKELQKDKTYDRVVISEDLEPFTNSNYETIDNFIFEKLDNISDEAVTNSGDDTPIILIATDRRTKADNLLVKIFGIGIYSALIGQDRSIEEVCRLIQKPRTKKEAKSYYKIDTNEVDYKPENEENVSETEIQNILTYYKRLGRNEDRYVESFDNIAAQYTDQQLRVIIKFLPLNVKAVLEANSLRYQQLMSFGGEKTRGTNYFLTNKTKMNNSTEKAISNDGIKVEAISSGEKRLTKPVIIPTANSVRKTQKVEAAKQFENVVEKEIPQVENIQNEPAKRRGRPKKVEEELQKIETIEEPKKRRGRPRKEPEAENEFIMPDVSEEDEFLSNFEDIDDNTLPGFDDIDEIEETSSAQFSDFDYDSNNDDDNNILPNLEESESDINNTEYTPTYNTDSYQDFEDRTEIENYNKQPSDLQGLLTQDKKIVAFVGTSKNGTSFLINNIAEILSSQGIRTAILDLTKNKNSYYIYTKNEEGLRKTAYQSIQKLTQGVAQGITVNACLDVYTSLPGEDQNEEQYLNVLQTLLQNYSLILLDCDFKTNYNYLSEAQEIYLVQSMDVLTIQPLTAYLRDLKSKGVLEQNKLKVVLNKYIRIGRNITEKAIIGGMSFYNDPAMSYMTELFNRETIPFLTIPFDVQAYSKYLEALVNCSISVNGYSKDFINNLRKLSGMVYPLIGGNTKYNNPKYNKYASNSLSNNMNSTLDKMRKNY